MVRRRPITLIELMLCLCLLLMVGGMVSLQGSRFFKSHHFRTSVRHLKSEARLLRLIAASLDADLTLIFRYDGFLLTLDIDTDEKLPYAFKPISVEASECLWDDKPLTEERVLYSRLRQPTHNLKITAVSESIACSL